MRKDRFRLRFFPFRRHHLARSDSGFTLIEVVVAIAILALLAGSIFRANSDSIRNMRRADALADAHILAQSLVAKVGNEIALQEGETSGKAGNGLQWRLQIQRYGGAADREQWPVAAYVVAVEVTLHNGADAQHVTLTTLRLGAKEASR
jgi:prepilin-type N-terminal cleavage/methylation domain-containing protein